MGDLATAREAHAQWEQTTRDFISDCEACELSLISELHGRLGEHQRALEIAGPILIGRMKCAEVPHTTYAELLETYWKLGRRDDAEATHRRGYRMIRTNREFITEHGWHIEHLLRAGNLERAAELVRRHLPWAIETADMDDRFMFFRSTRSFLRALRGQRRKNLRFRLPAPHGTMSPQQLHDWLEPQLVDLAKQFDSRNENSKYAALLETDPVFSPALS
jgi:hypothetical protein